MGLHGGSDCVDAVAEVQVGVAQVVGVVLVGKALDEFRDKYGVLGKKLQTLEELEANRKRGGGGTVHFMSELPEYKEISEKYMDEEKKLEQYRIDCKDEVMDLMKEHFFALWD